MYKPFFGFKERPFKLVPDPDFLYLSQSHEEALGHLNYAVRQGDGFVVITGEVGTGKTTVCRMFLEKLDDHIEAAYIFNPKLDSIQLLKAINDEFCINSSAENTKDLIDTLNVFLMKKKAEEKRAILIIDESQNLSKDVLEQLRLLSNLETTKNKLLQIILVGQPEFGEKLDSFELRQLEQRITLNCHLNPLTYKETREYIFHRIRIASHKDATLFTRQAVKLIYRYSKGIPRVINIVCDRALLCAFCWDKKKITRNIAFSAITELSGKGVQYQGLLGFEKKLIMLLVVLALILLSVIIYPPIFLKNVTATIKNNTTTHKIIDSKNKKKPLSSDHNELKNQINTLSVTPDVQTPNHGNREFPKEVSKKSDVRLPVEPFQQDNDVTDIHPGDNKQKKSFQQESLSSLLQGLESKFSRSLAIDCILNLWEAKTGVKKYLHDIEDNQTFFRLAATQNQLKAIKLQGDFELVKKINHPAILEFFLPKEPLPKYLVITGVENDSVILGFEKNLIQLSLAELSNYWSGRFYVIWKDFYNYTGNIPFHTNSGSIITLKKHLQEIGYCDIVLNTFYDDSAKDAIKDVQKRYGLDMDGIVGPLTKIMLYNESKTFMIPHLIKRSPDKQSVEES